jgi:hypothetical protein
VKELQRMIEAHEREIAQERRMLWWPSMNGRGKVRIPMLEAELERMRSDIELMAAMAGRRP